MNMSMAWMTKTAARNAFPRGCWFSWRWWVGDIGRYLRTSAILAMPMLFIRQARRIQRHRDEPAYLAQVDDGFVFGAFGQAALIGLAMRVLAGGVEHPTALAAVIGVALVNSVVAWSVVYVIAMSRLHQGPEWGVIDEIDRHAPRGRPPTTPREYDAIRLKASQDRFEP